MKNNSNKYISQAMRNRQFERNGKWENDKYRPKSNSIYDKRMRNVRKEDIQRFRPESVSNVPRPPMRPFEQQTWREKQQSLAWFLNKNEFSGSFGVITPKPHYLWIVLSTVCLCFL